MPSRKSFFLPFLLLAASACSRTAPAPPTPTPTSPTPPVTPVTPTPPASPDTAYWDKIVTPFSNFIFQDIWFTDTLHGFMTGYISQNNEADIRASVFSTSDGGLSWQGITPTTSYLLESIFFLNTSQGFIAGTKGIFYTMDGGKTWTEKLFGTAVNEVLDGWTFTQFLSPGTGYLANGKGLYKTTDTCTSWTLILDRPATTMYFNGASVGHAIYSPATSSKTLDGGATWQDIGQISPTANVDATTKFNYLQFTDDQHGWFLYDKALVATADGGATWSPVISPPASEAFYDLQMFNNQTGYACTTHTIIKTTDGGKTWKQVYNNSSLFILALSFTDERHGWVSCSNGVVLKYHPLN
ncbi:MAG TPA: YCF48-related protein [Puia sp.]|jgi:photosystem II stability/assembly factor-like uncharacterized protein